MKNTERIGGLRIWIKHGDGKIGGRIGDEAHIPYPGEWLTNQHINLHHSTNDMSATCLLEATQRMSGSP